MGKNRTADAFNQASNGKTCQPTLAVAMDLLERALIEIFETSLVLQLSRGATSAGKPT